MTPDLAHRALVKLGALGSFGGRASECLAVLRELERDAGRRGDSLRRAIERGSPMSWLVYESRRQPDGADPVGGPRLYPDGEHAEQREALERAAMLAARYSPAESLRIEKRGAETRVFGLGAVYGAVIREHNPGKRG